MKICSDRRLANFDSANLNFLIEFYTGVLLSALDLY